MLVYANPFIDEASFQQPTTLDTHTQHTGNLGRSRQEEVWQLRRPLSRRPSLASLSLSRSFIARPVPCCSCFLLKKREQEEKSLVRHISTCAMVFVTFTSVVAWLWNQGYTAVPQPQVSAAPQSRRIAFCFKATSDPKLQAEYKEHHRHVWPEMKRALAKHGWHKYSLFMRPDGLIVGVFESDQTLSKCLEGMSHEEVNARWQADMQQYFPKGELRPDEQMTELEEVMYLPD
eukprot:m.141622 g.141622  ORF g.141622 m.141622 type:complete len:232 (+) comp17122_c0_seq3:1706-2401(+)